MKSFIIIMMIAIFIFPLARISVASEVQRGERPEIDITQVPEDAIIPGRIHIKFDDEFTDFLDENDIYYEDGIALFGIPELPELDELNIQYEVTSIKAIFDSPALKEEYEWRRRLWGFHLWYQLEFDEGNDIVDMVLAYSDISELEWVEPEYKKILHQWIPDDPLFENQWHYHNTGQTGGTPGADISLPEAWDTEKGNSDVIVAIIDSGIQYDHPDLAANMWSEIGYNFVNDDSTIVPHNHGTHVAGTVAAVTNNNEGVAGIAGGSGYGDGVRLMSCQVFGPGGPDGFHIAPMFAADEGAAISQNSWGYPHNYIFESAVLDAIDYFNQYGGGEALNGGITIFSAGNDDMEGDRYPGCYSGTFAVAATNHNDQKTNYSNFDAWIDISAPGGEMPPNQKVYSTFTNSGYGYMAGTSMAAPHVSGVAALLISNEYGNLNPEQVKNILRTSADDHYSIYPNNNYDGKLGAGRLNAYEALMSDIIISDTLMVYGLVSLDGGSGDVTDVEITFEHNTDTTYSFTVSPIDETGYYYRQFTPEEQGSYHIYYSLYQQSSHYYPVMITHTEIFGSEPIELENITLKPITSTVYVCIDPSNNQAFNNIQDALEHHGLIGTGGSILINSGIYRGIKNRDLVVPFDPDNPYSIEISSIIGREVTIECGNKPGFIFDDNGTGTITEEYTINNLAIKNANPAIEIESGSTTIHNLNIKNSNQGIKILNGSPHIYSNEFSDIISDFSAIESQSNAIIEFNEFINCIYEENQQIPQSPVKYAGGILLQNSNGAIIQNNTFIENNAHLGGAISIIESSNILVLDNSMNDNTIKQYGTGSTPLNFNDSPQGLAVYVKDVDSLYFGYNLIYNNGEDITDDNLDVVYMIDSDNIDFINNTVIDHENHYALHIENVEPLNIINTILFDNYASFSGDIPETSYSLIDEQPYLDNDYIPIWNELIFSPAIDAGDPELPWNPDDTPPDIGAVRAIEHDFHITTGPLEEPERYLWRSFPVLDRIYHAGTNAGYVLKPIEEQTDYFEIFFVENDVPFYRIWDYLSWTVEQFDFIDSIQGYKIESDAHFSIPTSGFNQDYDTVIELDAGMNWVGYFIKETLSIDVALYGIWEYLEAVYSEDWAWEADDPHAIDPTRCTMIYGKMYKIVVSEPCELIYNTSEPVPPNERTMTDGFYYSETPMYSVIMIDEIDDPEAIEIGVFLDDVCIGATQIEEEPVQILAFPQDSSRSNLGGNIHFELYYGQRRENKRIREYTVRESQGSLSSAKLSLAPYKFNYVTLDSEPDEPITQLTTTNYPNPFNPETTISYSLPNDTHVEIEIFNIRGQLVKRLVDGEQPAGRYRAVWDGRDNKGRPVGSGVYFYRITTDEKIIREKMLLLK